MSVTVTRADAARGEARLYGYLCPSARALAAALPDLDDPDGVELGDLIEARHMLVTALDAQRREVRRADLDVRWHKEARKGCVLLMLAAGAVEDALDKTDPSWTPRRRAH